MAFDRPTIVDDSGDGESGTIGDAAWVDDFCDRIDEAIGFEQTATETGNQDNYDLDGEFTILRCTGAAPVFRGFTVKGAAPTAACKVLLQCVGTTVKVAHQDTNSTEANRIITPSTAGQIVGVNGAMLLEYDAETDRWRLAVLQPGLPVAIAHAGGNFTGGNSQTWTVESGDQVRLAYVQRGNVITLFYTIETSTVGGTPDPVLAITIPFTVDGDAWAVNGFTLDNNVAKTGVVRAVNNAATLRFYIDNTLGSNWAASTNQTSLRGSHTFTVD